MSQTLPFIDDVWDYLVEQGILDCRAAGELRRRGEEDRAPLGRILVEEGLLEMSELMRALRLSYARPYQRLGDIVVAEGLCSREDIERAVELQRRRSRHPIEYVLECPSYRRGPLFAALGEYLSMLESRVRRLAARLDEFE